MNIQKYLDLFEYQKDTTSDNPRWVEGFWSFKSKIYESTDGTDSPEYRAMSDLIHDSDLDHDSAYTFTVEALQAMQEIQNNHSKVNVADQIAELEDLENISQYSEAPIYNSELVGWMAKGTNWTFIDDVISEYGNDIVDKGILSVIQLAYTKAWEEHYFKVLEVIKG